MQTFNHYLLFFPLPDDTDTDETTVVLKEGLERTIAQARHACAQIWKDELGRMGGYVTNHGELEYARAEIILEGLARREDDIFRRRKESTLFIFQLIRLAYRLYCLSSSTAEERQDQNAKRRKLEASGAKMNGTTPVTPSPALQLTSAPTASEL